MNEEINKVYSGIILEEEEELGLIHLCHICNHTPDEITELVYEGILHPVGDSKHEWQFKFNTITRIRKVKRLQRDFELNLPSSALVMDLLDRIEELERKLKNTFF